MSSVLQEIKLSGTQELSSYLGVALEDVAVVDTASNLPNLEGQVTLEEAVDVVDYLCQCVQGMSLLDLTTTAQVSCNIALSDHNSTGQL